MVSHTVFGAKRHRRGGSPFILLTLLLVVGPLAACASLNNTEKGAAAGAGAGGVIGAVIGNQTGSTARGAIIGAAIGGAAGAVIGHRMDRTAEELQKSLDDATVTRVGEGILVTFDAGILFDFDSSNLRFIAKQELADLAQSLEEFPQTDVLVVGHTDSIGSPEYNQRLSERRAEAASTYLGQEGVDPDRIIAEGRGESEPVATNATEAGRQANRRVEVAIYASKEYRDEVKARYGGGRF